MLHRTMFAPSSRRPPSGPACQAMRVTPIGRALWIASNRAPSALHLMSLVRTETEAVITVVMRLHRPPPGAGTGWAMMHHLQYHQLWAVDNLGTRYTIRFEGGVARDGHLAGHGPVDTGTPARRPGGSCLVGDGTHLIQLPLGSRAWAGDPPRRRTGPGRPSRRRSRPVNDCSCWRPNASSQAKTPGTCPSTSRERSSRCSPRRARSPLTARYPVSSPRCASGSARPGTASPYLRQRRSRPGGPASSRTATRRGWRRP